MRLQSTRPVQRRAALLTTATLLAVAWPLSAGSQTTRRTEPLSEREQVVHLLSRATFGARPEDVDEVLRVGIEPWLDRQLSPRSIPSPDYSLPSAAAVQTMAARMSPQDSAPPTPPSAAHAGNMIELERLVVVATPSVGRPAVPHVARKLERSIWTPRQLEEVMTDFWFNHFSVSSDKNAVVSALASYEESAIRPYVFRRFDDMLVATARHPAMLMYLDNHLSRVPAVDSPQTSGGVNENYARELLELHTLGVDGGYTQQDVVEVARAFTGWGVPMRPGLNGRPPTVALNGNIAFEFRLDWHDAGEKVVLGDTLPGGRSIHDGLDVLHMLARHPSTARNVATKLVRHFVADDPPEALVDELTRVFLATDGDLREVTRTLFTSAAFYEPAHFRAKVRRPFEYVVSVHRMTGSGLSLGGRDLEEQRTGLVLQLQGFGHLPYGAPAPTGYPTRAEEWVSAGAMIGRMNLALEMLDGSVPGVALHPTLGFGERLIEDPRLLSTDAAERSMGLRTLVDAVLGRLLPAVEAPGLAAVVTDELSRQEAGDPGTYLRRAVALVLGSPEFQRY